MSLSNVSDTTATLAHNTTVFLPSGEIISYGLLVKRLIKECGDQNANLNHMALGLAGEAGELVDAIKKHTIYGKPLDIENIKEELGDLEFYITGLRMLLSLEPIPIIYQNMEKLSKRYASGTYSDAAAIERADKIEIETVAGSETRALANQEYAVDAPAYYQYLEARKQARLHDSYSFQEWTAAGKPQT